MNKIITAAIAASILSTSAIAGDSKSHWEYKGSHGPAHWKELSATCGDGKNQSPIDIVASLDADLPKVELDYKNSKMTVLNNGHTIQANVAKGNTFTNTSGQFDLLQFHFHAPSENTINGQSFPLETHLVHADKNGNLAVIGLMFKEGKSHPVLADLWEKMPTSAGKKAAVSKLISPMDLVPSNQEYFRFNGSLTTPPCSEGVRWFVMKSPIEASKAQIAQFRKVMGGDTNRPVQPINARIIVQ